MQVYHFINARFGLDSIRCRRLRISRLMELNDPFEFLGVDLSDRTFRKALRETKRELSKTKGLLCFSKTWTNPVLWSHYADKHRRLCLGFEVPNTHLGKVRYVKKRPARPSVLDESFMKRLLFTKFSYWRYEQEYRVYVQLDKSINGQYFADFSEQLVLKRVIVGDQCNLKRVEIAAGLGELQESVDVFKARAGFREFQVVRNKNHAMWA